MAKPQNKYDRKHLRNLEVLQKQIDDIFRAATNEAARIGVSIDVDTGKPFEFKDYPSTKERVRDLLRQFQASVEVCIVNGIESEWTLANNKNNELCNAVFGRNVGKLTKTQYSRYYSTNESARDAFIARKENGLSLSDRVWQYTNGFKTEMEMGLDLGIRNGLSADQISRDLRQYLQHPDMLFRRVRDEHGILHLSKRAAAFHPGQGVYRSSYLNARRLAVTETNAAYRTADHERWQNLDFVVGIEIHLSGNHTCKGRDGKQHAFTDICDELAGKYPKDFKFTGWHPHCRCYATTILKTEEEMAADDEKILRGEPVSGESVNAVKDVPDNFKEWMKDNEERMERAQSLPSFLKDNRNYNIVPSTNKNETEQTFADIHDKVDRAIQPRAKDTYVAFEPFSAIIIEKLKEQRDLKNKLRLFNEILNDERAIKLSHTDKAKTVMFPGHKGGQHSTWKGIKQTAKEINELGEDVIFLPERENEKSADALVLFNGKPTIADFKYCITKKSNTLSKDLIEGFGQAKTIVLKIVNMDAGVFYEAIDYLVRNNIPYGNIKLVNKYGKKIEITRREIMSNNYKKKVKGFL